MCKFYIKFSTFLTLSVVIWFLVPAYSHAESLSCGKYESALEIEICDNLEIRTINFHMNQVYQAEFAKLSKSGQKLLRDNQLQFLSDLESICFSTDPLIVTHRPVDMGEYGLAEGAKSSDDCLSAHLQARTKELETAVQHSADRTFLRLTSLRLRRPGPDAPSGYSDHVIEESLALVQIDDPRTPSEQDFNTWTKKLLKRSVCGMRCGDDSTSDDGCSLDRQRDGFAEANMDIWAEVSAAILADDIAAVQNDIGYYGLGAAHPVARESRALWSFKLGRELKAEDIFDSTKNWDAVLSAYAQRHVRPTIDGISKEDLDPIASIAKTENWSFERDGLRLIYGQYELGGYLASAEALLPWHVIAPFLKPNGILDWRALAGDGEIAR